MDEATHREQQTEIVQLTHELEASRAYTRTIIEEHASANEELKSAQEELLSSNEEFQSTNEELQTAKEELQSTNEELATTNDELRHRNQELHQLNEEAKKARDYADAIVEAVRMPLLVLDSDLRVLRANRAFYEFFKTTPGATEQALIYELGNGQWTIPELRRFLDEVLSKDATPSDYEVKGTFPGIGDRTLCLNAKRLSWADNAFILLAIEDITERQRSISIMQEGERLKDEFLAMLAHELRNPLATIRNVLELWQRGDASPETEKRAQAMLSRQLQKEIRLVDDLLDVSRITRGLITLTKETVNLAQVVHDAVEETQYLLDACGHELIVTLPPKPVLVEGDATRLEQIVANLLTNSIKFTAPPDGRIAVSLDREGSEALLKVVDNGMGIAPQMLSSVFDLFVQADRSMDRSQAGLGLGLTLARRLAELHGGSITATSAGLGHGSEFLLRLPVSPTSTISVGAKIKMSELIAAACRVLVVDDNVDAAESMADILRLEGHEVATAHDGIAALDTAHTFKPQVILLDIGLPNMNGYEVAKQLRKRPGSKSALLLAVSGYGQSKDRVRSKDAGFDAHLVKPVDPKTLRDLIAAHRRGHTTQ